MEDEVLNRSMFNKPMAKATRNSGIMAGFDDEEMNEPEGPEEPEEQMSPMARTPQNPEILMNTLRGDMRSVDARYQELADMVGEEAAHETPPEVLALLQAQMAPPTQGGIGALPQAPDMPAAPGAAAQGPAGAAPQGMQAPAGAPPVGGPPQGAPAGAPPMAPPQGLAHGGIVQHFQVGSGPAGVTPATDSADGDTTEGGDNLPYGFVTPELRQAAAEGMQRLAMQKPAAVPDLAERMQAHLPTYEKIMGGQSDDYLKARAYLDMAGRGFAFAANTDENGNPLRGNFMARLAGATKSLPASLGELAAEKGKTAQQLKLLALQAGEKDILATQAANAKLVESQRKLFGDILKSSGAGSTFGKGSWEWGVINTPGLMGQYAEGKTTPEQDALVESAATKLMQPRSETYTDELGKTVVRTMPGYEPPFMIAALKARRALGTGQPPAGGKAATTAPPAGSGRAGTGAGAGTDVGTGTTDVAPPAGAATVTPSDKGSKGSSYGGMNLFDAAEMGTGVVPWVASKIATAPGMGNVAPEIQQSRAFMLSAPNQITKALQNTTKLSETERKQVEEQIDLLPSVIDNPTAYRNRVIGTGQLLYRLRDESLDKAKNESLHVKDRNEAREKAGEIGKIIDLMGVPLPVYEMKTWESLAPGTRFMIQDAKGVWKPQIKK